MASACVGCMLLLASLPQLSANGRVGPHAPPPRLRHCSLLKHAPLRLRGGLCLLESPAAVEPPTIRAEMLHPVVLGLLGTCFGWLMTALGSAAVLIHRLRLPEAVYRRVLDFMLGVSGGVMTAASYWSLLAPALEFAEAQARTSPSPPPLFSSSAVFFYFGQVSDCLTQRGHCKRSIL